MLGEAGLHQAAIQTLRTSLLSSQSENTGGFVALCGGPPGTVNADYQILFHSCAVVLLMSCCVSFYCGWSWCFICRQWQIQLHL